MKGKPTYCKLKYKVTILVLAKIIVKDFNQHRILNKKKIGNLSLVILRYFVIGMEFSAIHVGG